MISNIGFNEYATHTQSDSQLSKLPVQGIEFPLMHPSRVLPDLQADKYTFNNIFKPSRGLNVIPRIMRLLGSR